MNYLIYVLINVLIIGLFLYSKLTPYKDRLTGNYKNIFFFFDKLFNPLFTILRKLAKPLQVGNGIYVDMSQIVLLLIFLILLKALL